MRIPNLFKEKISQKPNFMMKFKNNMEKYEPKGLKNKLNHLLKCIFPGLRDESYYQYKITKKYLHILDEIQKEANWLTSSETDGNKTHQLTIQDRIIKYYEYKNTIIQTNQQYVIIGLTATLLFINIFL